MFVVDNPMLSKVMKIDMIVSQWNVDDVSWQRSERIKWIFFLFWISESIYFFCFLCLSFFSLLSLNLSRFIDVSYLCVIGKVAMLFSFVFVRMFSISVFEIEPELCSFLFLFVHNPIHVWVFYITSIRSSSGKCQILINILVLFLMMINLLSETKITFTLPIWYVWIWATASS